MTDVKVIGGNNRQFDLLAIKPDGEQFHVESSVSHSWDWSDTLLEEFDIKFFGIPRKKTGGKTDSAKGKSYLPQINAMYQHFGMDPESVKRVYCTWILPIDDTWNVRIAEYSKLRSVPPIEVLSFRDTVLPELEKHVATSNYDDEVMRTLSLLRQRQNHVDIERKKAANCPEL